MRMCHALAAAGHDVTLVAKSGAKSGAALGTGDDHAFYGTSGFDIVKLARPAWRGGGVVFASQMALEVARRRADLVYARDVAGAFIAGRLRRAVVFEAHGIPSNRSARWLLEQVVRQPTLRGLVAISAALRADLVDRDLVPPHAPTIVAHDAADVPVAVAKRARSSRPQLGYVGNLYAGRGIELVLAVAERMPDCDVIIAGGSPEDLARWLPNAPRNVSFRGFIEPARLGEVYASLDVVLMPYPRVNIGVASGASDTSRWCSPMKMFEYMASGVPIVSSDLPVLQEILCHERDALIAPADNVAAWCAAIRRLLDEPLLASRLATTARDELERDHTWNARVRTIMTALGETR